LGKVRSGVPGRPEPLFIPHSSPISRSAKLSATSRHVPDRRTRDIKSLRAASGLFTDWPPDLVIPKP
jgi:hypothetical protein